MQAEINKLLKRLHIEKAKNNQKECIEIYNIIGGLCTDDGNYEEAIRYHEEALDMAKTIGDKMGIAIATRYVGEAKASLGQFFQAIKCIERYLELTLECKVQVEIQRAWTTLGRVYLMQAQDMKDSSSTVDDSIKDAAREAEKKFQKALNMTETLLSGEQIDEKEYSQMKSSLLINIGLVRDILGQHNESISCLRKAIDLCLKSKLKEDLYRCQILLTTIFRQRGNIKMAVKSSEEALATAQSIGKKLLICDAFVEKGLVKIMQRDFKNAKRSFVQAYRKSPNHEDSANSIRLTKLSHLIAVNHEKLLRDGLSSETKLRICDKLGDLFVAIGSYKLAIEFYRRAFSEAKVCSKPKTELARILYSIAETYADDGQFEHALVCYEKEFSYRNGNDSEQCQSLIKIAHMHEYLQHDCDKVIESYEKAFDKAGKNTKLMYTVVKDYLAYLKKKRLISDRSRELDSLQLNLKSYPEVISEIQKEGEEEINDLEDEIANIDDIISDDDDDDEVMLIGRRKTRSGKKFKANEVGDTPLHEACIKGDLKRVKSLLSQGHEVNPRDNAGWIPLHEACNHGHYEIVEHLIENGADVCNRGLKGMSPLHDAATNGHFDIMRILIRNGANVIALTDSGETVLSCLRDYKNRNYRDMSNQEMSEYKMMESELLNLMDKSGFNLMEEKLKSIGVSKPPSSSASKGALQGEVRPKSRASMNQLPLNAEAATESVKDYRDAIGTLKRKRLVDDTREPTKKANLPATYHTGSNTSVSTKDWLIDDVSRKSKILNRRSRVEDFLEEVEDLEDDDGNDQIQHRGPNSYSKTNRILSESPEDFPTMTKGRKNNKRITLESDDEEDIVIQPQRDEVVVIDDDSQNRRISERISTPMSDLDDFMPSLAQNQPEESLNSFSFSNYSSERIRSSHFDVLAQPLVVYIEDRKLLIPIKDNQATIKWLKEAIIERYSVVVDARPNISLAPVSDPTCILFDKDSCQDVVRENLVATVESWQLESMASTYTKNCAKSSSGIIPLDFIKSELNRLDQLGNKLDLSYTRFPRAHVSFIASALARRDFTSADLTGATSLFEATQQPLQQLKQSSSGSQTSVRIQMLDCVGTWRRLTNLSLKCVGLRRSQFEALCKFKFDSLKILDLSVNCVVYKCKFEFKQQIETLSSSCGSLKELDFRKNHLQFVKSLCDEASSSELPDCELESPSNNRGLDLAKALDLNASNSTRGRLVVLGSDQYEYTVYSS